MAMDIHGICQKRKNDRWVTVPNNLSIFNGFRNRYYFWFLSCVMNDIDINEEAVEDLIKEIPWIDNVDHTKCAYQYPLLQDKFACEINRDDYPGDRLRYDELFRKGTDIRHLVADYTGEAEKLEDFADPQIDWALTTVFGYD